MQTSIMELQGIALDWAVTQIDDPEALRHGIADWRQQRGIKVVRGEYAYRYHQSWNQSQPLFESARICMGYNDAGQAVAYVRSVSRKRPKCNSKLLGLNCSNPLSNKKAPLQGPWCYVARDLWYVAIFRQPR